MIGDVKGLAFPCKASDLASFSGGLEGEALADIHCEPTQGNAIMGGFRDVVVHDLLRAQPHRPEHALRQWGPMLHETEQLLL